MKAQAGMTLPELLVAAVVGLFVIGATLSVFTMSSGSVQSTGQYNQIQESARLGLRMIEQDLIQTGNFADLTAVNLVPNVNVLSIPSVSGTDCVGGGSNNSTFPNGLGHFRTLWAFELGGTDSITCQLSGASGSDVLQLKRLVGPAITAGSESSDRFYFVSNLSTGAFYEGGDVVPNIINGRSWEYQHRVYYVRTNDRGVPALFRRSLNKSALMGTEEELVEGVEKIRYEFGIDIDRDGVVDTYLPINDVTEAIWDETGDEIVVAVRIYMLMRSIDEDSSFTSSTAVTYNLPGGAYTASADQYRRRLITSTVMLRNPVLVSRGES